MKTAFLFLIVSAFFAGCDGHHEHKHEHGPGCSHDHGHSHNRHVEHAGGHVDGDACADKKTACGASRGEHGVKSVKVTRATQGVMGLKTVRAEMRRVSATFSCQGRFELLPDARQTVATPVAGRLSILVKPLAIVKKGDPLFTVSSPDLVARAKEISILEKRLAVYKEIKTRNAALENELAVKRAERAALIALADEKDGIVTVKAAADGLVESFMAKNGDWLETGASALQTVNPKALRLKALVASGDAARLRDGLNAQVAGLTGKLRLGIGDDTGLVPVYVVFDGDVDAIAGARADATVVTDEAAGERLAVPSECIVRAGLQPVVFVRDPHNAERFAAVPVKPLQSGGGWTAVEGLDRSDAEVVSEGVYELRLALPDGKEKSSGHFHADGTFHEGEH